MKSKITSLIFIFLILINNLNCSYAQTGIAVPSLVNCDNSFINFMNTYSIPGATVAIAKDGKLIYLRAFGQSNISGTELTQPYHLFRIASLSKPITSIAIMKLIENGTLGLNDKVFGPSGILSNHPIYSIANITDTRIFNITVKNLLEHSAGWNRDLNCFPNPTNPYPYYFSGCDPITAPLHVAQQTGTTNPVTKDALIKFLLEKGLDFTPGTNSNYSNIGYLILGQIIEAKTGVLYENYVKNNILSPLGICDMHIGKNLLNHKYDREGEYIGNGYTTLSSYGTGNYVPWEYGGFNIESMDSHGGWISTASDLVKLLVAVDGFNTKADILSPSTISSMVAPSTTNPNLAKGWYVNSNNNWWHTGALDGTASFLARTNNGFTWAIILNKRVVGTQSSNFWNDLDALPWNCITNSTSFPTHDLMLTPTTNSTNLTFSNVTNSSLNLNWVQGNGNFRLVLASKNTPVTTFPLDGINYSSNSTFGAGSHLGNNNYVVYNGNGNSVKINNLDPSTTYYFKVFEFNKNSFTGNYSLYRLCDSEQANSFTNNITGITSNQSELKYKVFANPSAGIFEINLLNGFTIEKLEIYSSIGQIKLVDKTINSELIKIDLSNQDNGIYILRVISTNGTIYTTKLIKV